MPQLVNVLPPLPSPANQQAEIAEALRTLREVLAQVEDGYRMAQQGQDPPLERLATIAQVRLGAVIHNLRRIEAPGIGQAYQLVQRAQTMLGSMQAGTMPHGFSIPFGPFTGLSMGYTMGPGPVTAMYPQGVVMPGGAGPTMMQRTAGPILMQVISLLRGAVQVLLQATRGAGLALGLFDSVEDPGTFERVAAGILAAVIAKPSSPLEGIPWILAAKFASGRGWLWAGLPLVALLVNSFRGATVLKSLGKGVKSVRQAHADTTGAIREIAQ